MGQARTYFQELLATSAGSNGGRRTAIDRDAYICGAAALVPRDI